MSGEVIVYKHRNNIVTVDLGIDVSLDTITSEIRSEPEIDAVLLATWTVSYATDGSDGKLLLTLSGTLSGQVVASSGWMDLKRVTGGETVPVFDKPLEVIFRGAVTA